MGDEPDEYLVTGCEKSGIDIYTVRNYILVVAFLFVFAFLFWQYYDSDKNFVYWVQHDQVTVADVQSITFEIIHRSSDSSASFCLTDENEIRDFLAEMKQSVLFGHGNHPVSFYSVKTGVLLRKSQECYWLEITLMSSDYTGSDLNLANIVSPTRAGQKRVSGWVFTNYQLSSYLCKLMKKHCPDMPVIIPRGKPSQ